MYHVKPVNIETLNQEQESNFSMSKKKHLKTFENLYENFKINILSPFFFPVLSMPV